MTERQTNTRTSANGNLSGAAGEVMHDLIVRRGLSYADAIRRAEAKAIEVAAPYREVADYLRRELERDR